MLIPAEDYKKILNVLPILCVDCLVVHDDRCLLLRRSREPAKGQYWFPGGRVFKGETINDTALRKAKEEANLSCKFVRKVSIEETIFEQKDGMPTSIHTVNVCCHLSVHNINDLIIDESHNEHIWVNAQQAKKLNLHAAVLGPLLKCFE